MSPPRETTRLWHLAPLLVLGAFAGPAGGTQEDAHIQKAWSRLTKSQRTDAALRFEAEVAELDTLQNRLLRRARGLLRDDEGLLAEDEPAPYYDPEVHAPDLPIARRRLSPKSSRARSTREEMFAKFGPRTLNSAWRYDWGSGEVLRTGDPGDPDRLFENALAGYPPGAGLAEALLEQALDDDSQRAALAAFGHAYTDREGDVFPLTLYDAWCSGVELEMPDVDNLGVIHDLLDDWTTWKSPVPESRQKKLYRRVRQLFEPAHRHRSLRTALARSYLAGQPDLRDGFEPRRDHLHALWQRNESDPSKVRAALPAPPDDEYFMADWGLEVEESLELRADAQERRTTLGDDGRRVRALMLAILADASAARSSADESTPERGDER